MFLTLLIPAFLQAQYTLSICSMFKNEADWMIEWIEYHRVIGVQHFFLYNNESTDQGLELLKPYVAQGIVEVIPWENTPDHWDPRGPGQNLDCYQIKAFNDCISKTRGTTQWLAILDMDEYIVPVHGKESLVQLLNDPAASSTGSFRLGWRIFGTSRTWEIPPGRLLIECLTMRAQDSHVWHGWTKSIHRPEAVEAAYVHEAMLRDGYVTKTLPGTDFRIHHYWMRDEKDFCKKRLGLDFKERPDFQQLRAAHPHTAHLIDFTSHFNAVTDLSIFQYVPEVYLAIYGQGSKCRN
jgi:hypothetical protein